MGHERLIVVLERNSQTQSLVRYSALVSARRAGLFVERDAGIGSLPSRAFGALVDGLVLTLPITLVGQVIFGIRSVAFAVLAIGASALYLIPQIATTGQTIGCRVARVRVEEQSTGSAPGWGPSTKRWALQPLLGVVGRAIVSGGGGGALALGLTVLVFGPALNDSRRRALHDRLAGTVVRDDA